MINGENNVQSNVLSLNEMLKAKHEGGKGFGTHKVDGKITSILR